MVRGKEKEHFGTMVRHADRCLSHITYLHARRGVDMNVFGIVEFCYDATPNVHVQRAGSKKTFVSSSSRALPLNASSSKIAVIAHHPLAVSLAMHKVLIGEKRHVIQYATEIRCSFLSAARGCHVPDSRHFLKVCIVCHFDRRSSPSLSRSQRLLDAQRGDAAQDAAPSDHQRHTYAPKVVAKERDHRTSMARVAQQTWSPTTSGHTFVRPKKEPTARRQPHPPSAAALAALTPADGDSSESGTTQVSSPEKTTHLNNCETN